MTAHDSAPSHKPNHEPDLNADVVDDIADDFDLTNSTATTATNNENTTPTTRALSRRYRTHIQELLSGSHRRQWSIALRGIMCGAGAGLLVVAYRAIIAYGNNWAVVAYQYMANHPLTILAFLFTAAAATAAIAKLVAWEPMATGSGIPQVEGVLLWGLKCAGGQFCLCALRQASSAASSA